MPLEVYAYRSRGRDFRGESRLIRCGTGQPVTKCGFGKLFD